MDREFLCITLDFDHDIIDGAPAARFAQHLSDLIESGHGLTESRGAEKANGRLNAEMNESQRNPQAVFNNGSGK